MNQNPAGIKFEAWLRRPVYKAQCATFAVARMLNGIKLEPGCGHVSQMGEAANGLTLMRALPAYRDASATALRDRVEIHIKLQRKQTRLTA